MAMNQSVSVTDVLVPRLLRIPDYQRGYAWEHEQVADFLEDLHLLEDGQRHYTGTVVLLTDMQPVIDDNLQALVPADVVDGQQRLTTIGLLLNEIRRALKQLGMDTAATGLKNQFLMTTKQGKPILKLQVQSDTHDLWSALINETPVDPPQTLSGRRLLDAAHQIREHVQGLRDAGGAERLTQISTKVMTNLQFTLYELDSQAEVGVVFETLNDRGKPLTELEKVKNYLLFLAARLPQGQSADLANRINGAWSSMYRHLLETTEAVRVGEDQFLRAHWLAAVDPVQTHWQGTKSVKSQFHRERYVGKPDLLVEEVGAYVESLRRAAGSFADSLRPDLQAFAHFGATHAAEARTLHAQLDRAGLPAVFWPMMIALRENAPEDGRGYIDSIELCLRFAVRTYLIGGYRADAAQTRLYRLAFEVFNGTRSSEKLNDGLRQLVAEYAPDDFVRRRLLDVDTNRYRWGGLTYFLYEYELTLLKGANPDLTFNYVKNKREKTIEHILPQKATSDYWTQHFSAADRARLTHALGNLVLTRDNSAYSNHDFPVKRGAAGSGVPEKTCYAQSPLRQEQNLAPLENWTPQEILDRQQRLTDWALERWAVAAPSIESEPDHLDDVLQDTVEEDQL